MQEHKQRRQRDPVVAVLKRMVLNQQIKQEAPFPLTKNPVVGLIPDFRNFFLDCS